MRAPPTRLAFFLSLLVFVAPKIARAQAFTGDFSLSSGAVYQTAGAEEAKAVAVDTITAGGPFVYVAGDSNNSGATVKLSSAGVALASAPFINGGTGVGRGVAVDPTGNVWVVGHSVTGGPLTNWVVQKYAPNLVVIGSAVISGFSLGDAVATSVAVDGSGNAFVAGYSSNTGTGRDFRVVKYSPSLVALASTTFGGAGVDEATAVALDASGGVFVTGYRTPFDYVTVKFSSSLVVLSSAVFDAAGGNDRAYAVATDPSGSVYVTGDSDSGGSNAAFTTVKYDSGLAQTSTASYNTPSFDAGFAAVFVGTTTLVVAGSSFAGATEDMLILEYDASLALVSSRTFDSGTADRAYGAAKGTGTYVYATGYSFASASGEYRTLRLNDSATPNPAYPGCAATNNVGAGQAYATIQSAVDGLPASLPGPACVVIRDAATYPEQVTVRNFANNGYPLSIFGVPGSGLIPVVSPPAASTAAFLIANASINVQGLMIAPGADVAYGIHASSSQVSIASVTITTGTASFRIWAAGMRLGSWNRVSYSSVSIGAANGFELSSGSFATAISFSTAAVSSSSHSALSLLFSDSNTVTKSHLSNPAGYGATFNASNGNSISQSTLAGNRLGASALLLSASDGNAVTGSVLSNPAGNGAGLFSGSDGNTISQSTVTSGGQAALYVFDSDSNTVTGSFVSNSWGWGARLDAGADFNTIGQSTISGGASDPALAIAASDSNTVTGCYITSSSNTVAYLETGADYNTISQSTMAGALANAYALLMYDGSYNTVTQSRITNGGGWAAAFGTFAMRNTISLSTITSAAAGYPGVYFMAGSGTNTVTGSYIQGSTAAYVIGVNGAVIDSSVLAGGAAGPGILLGAGSAGAIVLSSSVVTGAQWGVVIATQPAALSISSLSFTGLSSSATAVRFLGGTFVATITAASFDASAQVNVDAAALDPASRVTMNSHTGARTGAAYESDPAGLVDWQDAGDYPGCATTRNVGASQPFSSISAAVASLPTSLAGHSCVVIRDGATYAEQVTVQGFTMNGSSITIMADPGSGVRPKVSPPAASTAAFVLANASVTVRGIDVAPTNAVTYGILISSAHVSLDGVNVQDAGGKIGWSGVAASSWTTISGTSITVGGGIASALWLRGSLLSTVTNSTASAGSATGLGLWLEGASSNTFVSVLASNAGGNAAKLEKGSHFNSIGASTITTTASGYAALWLDASSSNTITAVKVAGPAGGGAVIQNGSDHNAVDGCEFTAGAFGLYALDLSSAAYNAVTRSFMVSAGGYGLIVSTSAHDNAVSLSTITSVEASYAALTLTFAASNSFSGDYFQGATAVKVYGSSESAISNSVLTATAAAGAALIMQNGSSGLTLAGSSLRAPPTGAGISFAAGGSGLVSLTTNTVSGASYGVLIATQAAGFSLSISSVNFAGLAPGATAVNFTGGTFVSTISAAYFDGSVTVNVDAAALNPASRVTMSASYGPRAGAAYENDPGALVDWAQVAAPPVFAATAVSESAILWTWTDASSDEAGYRVMSGTVSVSGDLPAGTTLWLQAGLSTNTAYGPYVARAFNAGGVADSTAAARTTLAAAPATPAASGVALTSATVSWGANGNPAGTTFELERSTGAGFGLLAAGPATSYFDALLTPAATFYYRVRAINAESVATAYSSTLAVVALPAPSAPGAAGTPAGTPLGISSVAWTWTLANGASSYNLFRSSDGGFHASSSTGALTLTALAPNTAYGLRAAGVNIGGTGPLSAAATVYTLAADPSGAAAVSITSTSLVASWGLNGNPASTVAQLQRSTDAVAYSTLTAAAVASYADADLLGCTTYYYRVRNLNGDGVPTAYASFSGVTGNTVPSPPSGLSAAANAGGTVGLSWALSPTEGVTGYRLYWDAGTGAVSYAAPIAILAASATGYTTAVLTSSAAYTFALRAAHRCGTVETTGALAMSGAAAALPALRAAVKEPDSGRRISGDRVTILGELVYGETADVQQTLFQYKLAASTAWLSVPAANLNHPNPDLDFPYFTHWDTTLLAAGSYDLRAVAYDRSGVPDAAPPAVRVVVDPVAPDIRETLMGDGKIKKEQTISNAVSSVVETAGAGEFDCAVRVTLPPGVVDTASTTVSVIASPAITTAAPRGQVPVGSAIRIDLSNGQTALNGTAQISLTYPESIRFPSLLQIYYLDEATGRWSRDFATTVDTGSRTVTGLTPHFSTFVLMLGTAFAPDLSGVQAYPVPYKPNGNDPDEGRPFSHADANSGIIFANLASGSTIKIYTLTGRLVSSLDNPTIAGTVRWDAKNQDGRDVASGAYFAVISAPGQKSAIRKLVIIR